MYVWVVFKAVYYPYQDEDKTIMSIYDCKEKAEAFIRSLEPKPRTSFDYQIWKVE